MSKFLENKLKNFYFPFSARMFRWTLWAMLASSIIIPLALVALPYSEWFNDMAVQPLVKAQSTYGRIFDQHLILERRPPADTRPREITPYPIEGNDPCSIVAAVKILQNPTTPTMENLSRGRTLYDTHCYVCHGKTGYGDGPVVIGPTFPFPAPPSLHTDAARKYPDARIYHVITKGQNTMPPYEFQIDPRECWYIVNYIHALQRSQKPTPQDLQKFKNQTAEDNQ